MKTVILAGGEGTRLRPLTFTRPKPMLPIGPKAVIEYLISHLSKIGFDDIVLTLSYKREHVMHHLGDGTRFGARINYSVEPEGLFLGTAGSVKMINHLLNDTFLVVQGDAYTEIDLNKVVDFHKQQGSLATIVLKKVPDPSWYGVAVTDQTGRISGFQEKPSADQCASDRISTGMYVLEQEVLDFVSTGSCDFAKDVFPRLLDAGKKIYGFECKDFWVDMGSLEGYLQGMGRVLDQLDGSREENPYKEGESKVWIGQNTSIDKTAQIRGPSLIEDCVVVDKDACIGPYALLKTESRVGEKTFVEHATLFEGASVGSDCTVQVSVIGEKAFLGKGVTVNNAVVGQGCFLKDGTRVCPDSRIWPSVTTEAGTVVRGILQLQQEKPFYFYTDIGRYTGVLATSISSLIEAFTKVTIQSLEFHIHRRDFERWIRDVLQSPDLAENIANLRERDLKGEKLRQRLIKVVEEW